MRIISSDERYTIADVSFQSAPDQEPTHQRQEVSSSNQETKVHSKSNRNYQGSAKPKKTKPTQHSFLPNTLQFVIGKINDCPDSGACISVISYEFVKEVLHDDAHPEIAQSTFPEVHTVSGEKLPTIGQIQVTLLLNGRQFPCQFHVINNVAYDAVLGTINNFSEGTLKLDKTYPLKMTLGEEYSRPLALLTVVKTSPVARSIDVDKFLSKLPHYYSAFLHRCKKAHHFFLKLLLILLLISFADLTSWTCQLPNQARINNRLTRRMQISQ